MNVSAAVKVGILFTVLAVGMYAVLKTLGGDPSESSPYVLHAKFKDAGGLPQGSRVVVAGLPVGVVDGAAIEGRQAKITVRLREDLAIYENAIIFKKAASLLGAFYLEIDPGTAESIDASGEKRKNRRLETGQEIARVVEATSPEQLMRRIEQSLPNVDAVLLSVKDLSEDVREIVNGPVASLATRLDSLVRDEAVTVSRILDRTDRTMARIEGIAQDIRRQTSVGGKVDDILDNLDQASVEARELVKDARSEVDAVGNKVREKLDLVDEVLVRSASIAEKIDDDQGTLGRLVNDSTLADNLEDITEDAKGFLGTIFGLQTRIGLRGEYLVKAGQSRFYVTLELRPRPDKFYYIELSQGPRANRPEVSLVYDPGLGAFRQQAIIDDKLRFTFQFAKQVDWLTLRYGIKESSGGIGLDGTFFDGHLQLSADIFDASFDTLPRLKLGAAIQFFGFLYIMGGIDDALNAPDQLAIAEIGPVTNDGEPLRRLSELHFGRDYYFGAMLKFSDLDLAALLTVGGSALAGLSQ